MKTAARGKVPIAAVFLCQGTFFLWVKFKNLYVHAYLPAILTAGY